MQARGDHFLILDVREPYEVEECSIGGTCLPMGDLLDHLDEIPRDLPVVVHCHSGRRSSAVVDTLSTRYGFNNLMQLTGGILAYEAEARPAQDRT